ncbi:MAG: ATP-dependent Clp protease proteolytic subunit [Geminicoccaceae bacterium]
MRRAFERTITTSLLSLALSFQAVSAAQADLWDDSCKFMNLDKSAENSDYESLSMTVFGPVDPEMHRQITSVLETSLNSFPNLKTFKLYLSSRGGDIDAGVAVRNYLLGLEEQHGIKVIAHNIGEVMSAAVDIFCAASERYAAPNTVFLVHNGQGDLVDSDWSDIENLREQQELEIKNSVDIFTACTSVKPEEAIWLYADQTVFGPDRALEFGMIKEVKTATFEKDTDVTCKLIIPSE